MGFLGHFWDFPVGCLHRARTTEALHPRPWDALGVFQQMGCTPDKLEMDKRNVE
jgi:hypothetical protein